MNRSAILYDKPFDSAEHRMFAQELWLVGGLHSVRYWLGRLCERNLYWECDDKVIEELNDYFLRHGWDRSVCLLSEPGCWNNIAYVLQLHAHAKLGTEAPKNMLEAKASESILNNPELNDETLAESLQTTRHQIARIVSLHSMRMALGRSRRNARKT